MRKILIIISKPFTKLKAKKVIQMKPQKVQIGYQQAKHVSSQSLTTDNIKIQKYNQNSKIQITNWQNMPFDLLCRLSIPMREKIIYDLKKYKFNSTDQEIKKSSNVASTQFQEIHQLSQYDKRVHGLLTNKISINQHQIPKIGYMGQMEFEDPFQDQQLLKTIQKFVTTISEPQKLQIVGEATFNKYLLGIKRDLMIKGVELQKIPVTTEIKLIKVLKYEHQFWVDLHHNRSKNSKRDQFIVFDKQIQNPNQSLVFKDKYPFIDIKYIARKRKRLNYLMCFCTKLQMLISLDDKQHTIKVEWIGPSQRKNKKDNEHKRKYVVIDFDNIYRGNPTIPLIFNF